jgi:hypothetical protein
MNLIPHLSPPQGVSMAPPPPTWTNARPPRSYTWAHHEILL